MSVDDVVMKMVYRT